MKDDPSEWFEDMCHAGMPHLFYALSGVIPAAKDAVVGIGAGLSAWLAISESRQH